MYYNYPVYTQYSCVWKNGLDGLEALPNQEQADSRLTNAFPGLFTLLMDKGLYNGCQLFNVIPF